MATPVKTESTETNDLAAGSSRRLWLFEKRASRRQRIHERRVLLALSEEARIHAQMRHLDRRDESMAS